MSDKLTELLDLLELEQIDQSIFRARHPASRTKRLFGGQIMAQALMAAQHPSSDAPATMRVAELLRDAGGRMPSGVQPRSLVNSIPRRIPPPPCHFTTVSSSCPPL